MKMKKSLNDATFATKMVVLATLLAVGTLANYSVHLHGKVGALENLLTLAEMRSDVNTEWANEVTWSAIHGSTKEMLKEQGKIEGIVSVVSPDNDKSDYFSTVWHEGYERGLNQNEDMVLSAEESGYVKGYKEALTSVGKSIDESEVLQDGKPIDSSAIKTPAFDNEAGRLLKSNEQLRKELNESFNERFKSNEDEPEFKTLEKKDSEE